MFAAGRAKLAACLLLFLCVSATACNRPREVILASTTSTLDSGLFDELIPAFEHSHDDTRVKVVAVGSGEAMALGRRGDADVLLVHSPAAEEQFMADGYGERRMPVMANDFVIAGPSDDPAGVLGETDAANALRKISSAGAPFVSRGDNSGTHAKELRLWRDAGVEPGAGYIDAGQGMGQALTIASERHAYILTDRGTFLSMSPNLSIEILLESDERLLNPYSVIIVRRARNIADARVFADWLLSPEARKLIREFGRERYGQPLFIPAADSVRT